MINCNDQSDCSISFSYLNLNTLPILRVQTQCTLLGCSIPNNSKKTVFLVSTIFRIRTRKCTKHIAHAQTVCQASPQEEGPEDEAKLCLYSWYIQF